MSLLPGSKIPLLATHKIISHIWEDAPRKVNNEEPDFRFFHGNFWPVMSRTIRKPCFSAWIPRGQIFTSPELVGTLPQALFFFGKKGPHIFTSSELLGTLPQAPFFRQKRAPYFWARIHQIWARIIRARHGNPPPPVKGGTGVFLTRHGTSESQILERRRLSGGLPLWSVSHILIVQKWGSHFRPPFEHFRGPQKC